MDLPTYTNIWRIEKRLYKLYDFRLPMPVPVGQIAVFTAIAVPYVVILQLAGLPFSHTLLWLYILPPGVMAWLVSRPVLEQKRLPELVGSQIRYLFEPRTWCRLAPLAEPDHIVVTARVWRRVPRSPRKSREARPARPAVRRPDTRKPATRPATAAAPARLATPARPLTQVRPAASRRAAPAAPARPAAAATPGILPRRPESAPCRSPAPAVNPVPPVRPAPPVKPAQRVPVQAPRPDSVPAARAVMPPPAVPPAAGPAGPPAVSPAVSAPAPPAPTAPPAPAPPPAASAPAPPAPPAPTAPPPAPPRARPTVTVAGGQDAEPPLRLVERALSRPARPGTTPWRDQVVVAPGGYRPGKPDQSQRDRARARLPLPGGHRVVVLGCTVGAGQTMTTLMTAELLASLRGEKVAVLDLNPGSGSLAERATAVPALTSSKPPAPSKLEVITAAAAAGPQTDDDPGTQPRSGTEPRTGPADAARMFELVSARYLLTIADPGAAAVPRVLAAATQLVLVAPASQDAASALAATREWLEAHALADLADGAITVLNGVSKHTLAHVEAAEALARGRSRAIVRIPWDDSLRTQVTQRPSSGTPADRQAPGPLGAPTIRAYTALAGLLVAAIATSAVPQRQRASERQP